MSDITIFHDPACGTSRNVLALLDEAHWTDGQLIDLIVAHPILINRPVVVAPLGTRLCRPSDTVLDLLPNPQRGAFNNGDGEAVVDAEGRHVVR